MYRDNHNKVVATRSLSAIRVSDDTAQIGQIIDTQGFSSLEFLIATGTLADSNATFAVLMEHSDDSGLSGSVEVPDSNLLGTEADAGFAFGDDDTTKKIGYRGDKRYVRMTITPSGNGSAADFSCIALQGHRHEES